MKLASWNVNSLRVRLDHVLEWLDGANPDVLALQETKVRDEHFPVEAFAERGYRAVYSGQSGYNGVALISREAPVQVSVELDGFADPQRRVLAASCGPARVINLYVPNGQRVDSDKYRYKLEWLAALRAHLASELMQHELCAVVGDFNIAPEDRDVHDPAAWEGKVLCSPPERSALSETLAVGFEDTFRLFEQPDGSYSWWDYRAGGFRRNRGLRIDLILASAGLSRRCSAATIDPAPRGRDRPSDHAPVIAQFDLP